jgi:gas vesicle protein
MNENDGELGAFLAGFVIGALVGGATALILAPQSGRATREQLATISTDIRNAGTEQISHVRSAADNYTHDIKDKATALMDDTRERAQQLGDQVQDQVRIVLDSGKDQIDEVAENLEQGTTDS